jgi:hypothetical protein
MTALRLNRDNRALRLLWFAWTLSFLGDRIALITLIALLPFVNEFKRVAPRSQRFCSRRISLSLSGQFRESSPAESINERPRSRPIWGQRLSSPPGLPSFLRRRYSSADRGHVGAHRSVQSQGVRDPSNREQSSRSPRGERPDGDGLGPEICWRGAAGGYPDRS